jgi:hypothetical protein
LHANTTVSNNAANSKTDAPAEVNTYCSFKGKPTNRVLLATAFVEVRSKFNQYIPCHVMLDSGSQMNFITEGCVQKLKLVKSKTPVVIQGINDVNTTSQCFHSLAFETFRLAYHYYLCSVATHYKSNSSNKTGHNYLENSKGHQTS